MFVLGSWAAALSSDLGMTSSVLPKCCPAPLPTCCCSAGKIEWRGTDFSFEKTASLHDIVALLSDKAFTVFILLCSGVLPARVLCLVSCPDSRDVPSPPSALEGSTTSSCWARSFLRIDNYYFFLRFPQIFAISEGSLDARGLGKRSHSLWWPSKMQKRPSRRKPPGKILDERFYVQATA